MSAVHEQEPLPEVPTSTEQTVYTPFRTVDVTEPTAENIALLLHARVLIADEYMQFHCTYDPAMPPRDEERLRSEVFEKLCIDEYSSPDRSRTLVALTEYGTLAGTLRFVFGEVNPQTEVADPEGARGTTPHPIETMALMESSDPNSKWPDLEKDLIAEVGRVAVASSQREREKGNTSAILRSLMERAFAEARARNIDEINVVMPTEEPRKLFNAFLRAGLQPELVSGITVRTDGKARAVTEEFPGYWKLNPRLHTFQVPPAKAA